MKLYHYNQAPLQLFGVPMYDREGKLQRLPDAVIEAMRTLTSCHTAAPVLACVSVRTRPACGGFFTENTGYGSSNVHLQLPIGAYTQRAAG